jgi:hypothetical protein
MAEPIHQRGRLQQLWLVEIRDEQAPAQSRAARYGSRTSRTPTGLASPAS